MNKNIPLFSLLTATLLLPLLGAVAAPVIAAPANAPKWAPSTITACKNSSLLTIFDKIPGVEFAGFGGVNRRSLLKRKGAIVDTARKYIMIPAAADPEDGTLRYVQISVLRGEKPGSPMVAVSRIMWNDWTETPNTLRFYYGYVGDRDKLWSAKNETVFPYELGKGNYAELPRNGTTIREMDRDTNRQLATFRWDSEDFRFYKN